MSYQIMKGIYNGNMNEIDKFTALLEKKGWNAYVKIGDQTEITIDPKVETGLEATLAGPKIRKILRDYGGNKFKITEYFTTERFPQKVQEKIDAIRAQTN